MSTTFLEKVTSELAGAFAMLPPLMKRRETLADYVNRHMTRLGYSQSQLEQQAITEAKRRGLQDTHKISDATISNIINDKQGSIGMYTLMALSWAIGRPIEEVVTVAFALEAREDQFKKSEFHRLWDLHQQITDDDEQRYFDRQVSNLGREMENAIENAPKKSRRSSG
jgi:hypothetical protein